MIVYQLERFGLDGVVQAERAPAALGPNDVRVRTRAVSLNYRDWLLVQGAYNPRQKLPVIPCSDGSGEAIEIGAAVTRFKTGDRVVAAFSQTWLAGPPDRAKTSGSLGSPRDGMLAEEVVLNEQGLLAIPEHLSFEEAATLPCAGVTAWHALFEEVPLQPSDTVVLQGTGGVSIFALQFAKMAGARAIITSSSDEKLDRARALGADETVNYRSIPDWDKRVRELTGGVGADVVIEVGGAGTLDRSVRAVRMGGYIAVIGVLAGAKSEILVTPILMQNIRVQGVMVGNREMFERMNRAIAQARLRPVIDRVFPFEQAREAFAYLGSGAHFGKICIATG